MNNINKILIHFKLELKKKFFNSGTLIQGIIKEVKQKIVIVDVGLKSESFISIEEFGHKLGKKIRLNVGDITNFIIEDFDNGNGQTILSREKALRFESLYLLDKAYNNNKFIKGLVIEEIKGGFTVLFNNCIKIFLPISLIDFTSNNNEDYKLLGKSLNFKVVKFIPEENNIIVSTKAELQNFNIGNKVNKVNKFEIGMIVNGIVKNITSYGAFIDLGNRDGLLHITDLAWIRIKHPSDIIKIGENIKVIITNIDNKINRISLGLKQLTVDPWTKIGIDYKIDGIYWGKIINVTDYGCFIELDYGIEGLIHISEFNFIKNKINMINKIKFYIRVNIINIDTDKRRISLGIKDSNYNIYYIFKKIYKLNTLINVTISNITDIGIIIDLKSTINFSIKGLIYIYDISWYLNIFYPNLKYLKYNFSIGDNVKGYIKLIDYKKQRLMLTFAPFLLDPINIFLNKINNLINIKLYIPNFILKLNNFNIKDNNNYIEDKDNDYLYYQNNYFIKFKNFNNKEIDYNRVILSKNKDEVLIELPGRINGIILNIKKKKLDNFYKKHNKKILKIKILTIDQIKREFTCIYIKN